MEGGLQVYFERSLSAQSLHQIKSMETSRFRHLTLTEMGVGSLGGVPRNSMFSSVLLGGSSTIQVGRSPEELTQSSRCPGFR